MPATGSDDRIRVSQHAGRETIAEAQHAYCIHAAALHYLEIEPSRKNIFSAGQYYGCLVSFSPVECRVDLTKKLGRQGIALAIVDTDRGDVLLEAVVNELH